MFAVGAVALAFSAAKVNAEESKTTANQPFAASMTVVPPGPVSEHVEVEVRLAVRNHSPKAARFEVTVVVEASGKKSRPILETTQEIGAGDYHLFTARFSAADFIGNSRILCNVVGPDGARIQRERPINVVASDSRALPLIQIGWIDPGAVLTPSHKKGSGSPRVMTKNDLRHAIDCYRDLGMSGFVITYPEYSCSAGGTYYPSRVFSEYPPAPFDIVGTILNQASKNGQHVFVGLGRGPDMFLTWDGFDDPKRQQAALAHSMKAATELWHLYSHEPSFYGWYLTHEANNIEGASQTYYNPVVEFLRTFEADKPVMVSPSGTPILSRKILSASKVDIFAYQDAVGAGYVPYEYTYDPQRRIKSLDEVYAKYVKAHRGSGKHLWANLETWQMDGPIYSNSYPPKFERVKQQLEIAARHVDLVTAYQLVGFMDPPNSNVAVGGKRAIDLFSAYRNYHKITAGRLGLADDDDEE
jgi:hypothetical protein